jgi:hypothetical protein
MLQRKHTMLQRKLQRKYTMLQRKHTARRSS